MNIAPAMDSAVARPRRITLSLLERPLSHPSISPREMQEHEDLRRDLEVYRAHISRATHRWEPLVETMDRRPMRSVASLILESYAAHRLGELTGGDPSKKEDAEAALRRELPFIVQVIQHLAPLSEMISIQPMLSPSAFIFCYEDGDLTQTPVKALTRLLRGTWRPDALATINASGDATARSIAYQIQREIIARICAHANICEVTEEVMAESILDTISSMWQTCPRGKPWLILPEAMAERASTLIPHFVRSHAPVERYGLSLIGQLSTPQEDEHGLPREDDVWGKVFVDPALDPSNALLGVRGDSMMASGYVYSPFLVALPTEAEHGGSIRTRGAHKLINPDFFRVLQLKK